jgi:fibronectin type 3 domain-containing protein
LAFLFVRSNDLHEKGLVMIKRISITICLMLVGYMLSACGTSSSGTSPSSAPTGVVLTSPGANQLTISWQPVPRATSYNLYWSTASGVTIANGTKIANASSPYTHSGLTPNNTYYYLVTAVGSSGESAASSQVSATSQAVPATPGGVFVIGGSNQATVSWSTVSGATSYNLYWSTLSGVTKANGAKIANISPPYIHTDLSANTTYYYIITAVNNVGESAASFPLSAATATVAGPAPSVPTGVSASGGTNQITVLWDPVSGATSYNVYWSTDNHVMSDMSPKTTGVTSPYHNTGLAAGATYFYAVTALNGAGESIESTIVSATASAIDGVALYSANCASCHGALAVSSKSGRTATQTQAAISANRGGMGTLSTLSAAQVQAITDVLAL